jgi:uncharacterized protein (DUF433 family)
MTVLNTTEQMPLQIDSDGVMRVGGTRVTLDTVVILFEQGATAEEIVQRFSSLDLADVYFAIGYYLRHRVEVEQYLQKRQQQAHQIREQNEARFDPHGLRDRLVARRALQETKSDDSTGR